MPNYDIIPLANDLLDYTIQRVKAKETEYRKINASAVCSIKHGPSVGKPGSPS